MTHLKFPTTLLVLFCLGFACFCMRTQAAAPMTDPRVRTAQQAYNSAQSKVNQARQQWDKAQQDFASALAAQQSASNKVVQARQAAARKHGAELGLTAVVAERDTALRQMSARRKAIEADLKPRGDYQDAERETEAARKRLGELGSDKSLAEDERARQASELAAAIRLPTEMLKKAEANDSELRKATDRWQAANKKILELQHPLKKAIDADPAVTQAVTNEKQAATALEQARGEVKRTEQTFTTAQAGLDRQTAQLETAIDLSRRRVRRAY
jgi:chromosome segregation ATPase